MKKVLAKFKCDSVTNFENGKTVNLSPVQSGSEENKAFAHYTPSGRLEMYIDNGTEAANLFEPGEEYFLEFSKAEKEA